MPYGCHDSNVGIDPDGYIKEWPRRVRNPNIGVCRNGPAPTALAPRQPFPLGLLERAGRTSPKSDREESLPPIDTIKARLDWGLRASRPENIPGTPGWTGPRLPHRVTRTSA
jgi:hypothetical protein